MAWMAGKGLKRLVIAGNAGNCWNQRKITGLVIIHVLDVFNSWIVHAWSLKTGSCSRVDYWVINAWQVFDL